VCGVCVCVCVCVCVTECLCFCVSVCLHVCMHLCLRVRDHGWSGSRLNATMGRAQVLVHDNAIAASTTDLRSTPCASLIPRAPQILHRCLPMVPPAVDWCMVSPPIISTSALAMSWRPCSIAHAPQLPRRWMTPARVRGSHLAAGTRAHRALESEMSRDAPA
jgi:hypothetical protein